VVLPVVGAQAVALVGVVAQGAVVPVVVVVVVVLVAADLVVVVLAGRMGNNSLVDGNIPSIGLYNQVDHLRIKRNKAQLRVMSLTMLLLLLLLFSCCCCVVQLLLLVLFLQHSRERLVSIP
jgi:hypothetical protein